MRLKVSVNNDKPVRVYVFFSLNRVGKYDFKDSKSGRTSKLHYSFKSFGKVRKKLEKNFKKSSVGMWGVYPEAIDLNIALHTQILFG